MKYGLEVVLDGFLENLHDLCGVLCIVDVLVRLVEREGVLELLGQVLVDGLAALQDGPPVFEALDLF